MFFTSKRTKNQSMDYNGMACHVWWLHMKFVKALSNNWSWLLTKPNPSSLMLLGPCLVPSTSTKYWHVESSYISPIDFHKTSYICKSSIIAFMSVESCIFKKLFEGLVLLAITLGFNGLCQFFQNLCKCFEAWKLSWRPM
jgi:hypothetical protein